MLSVLPPQTLSMQARDGVRLDADVYYPDAAGLFPVLLMRQPYGRAIASTVVYAHPNWYAAQGYIVVIQDVRGRGSSEGEFQLFAHEVEDGYDAVNWAAQLPQSNGKVGMYGFSYQGMTQLYAAVQQPEPLKVLCPAMVGYDLYGDWAYEGGAFCLQANLAWALQLAAETARRKGDSKTYHALYQAAHNLPLGEEWPARPQILNWAAPDSFYHEWLVHAVRDDYWEALSPSNLLAAVDIPMLHIGGWYDTFLRGTLNLYQAMAARSQQLQYLLVGPWSHLPWGQRVGAVDFGAAAVSPCDRWQVRWFDHFLKGIDTGLETEAPIHLFELGGDRWCQFDFWEVAQAQRLYLVSNGLAAIDPGAGGLAQQPLPDLAIDTLVHDPWRPVPSLGGHASFPAGCFDRAALDQRSDILTYTTEALKEDWHLVGIITLELTCAADTPSFDLCAVLSEVRPDGTVFNLSQGYRRIFPQEATTPLKIDLQPICAYVRQGHGLRLSLSGACFPAYAVNDGTGQPPGVTRLIDQRMITVKVYSGKDAASCLLLPRVAALGP